MNPRGPGASGPAAIQETNLAFEDEVAFRLRKMRMTFNKSSQLLLVAVLSLLAAGLLTACGTLTVDFVYVTSAKAAGANNYGEIDVFEINSESGRMRSIPTSPFPSGGRNPVAEAVSPDNADLYVVNQDDNTIVQFIIGTDGKVYPQNTVNTPGVFPLAVATAGGYLFLADTYQPLPSCSTASPCSGSVAVFPILTASQAAALSPAQPPDTLGSAVANTSNSANYWPLTLPAKPTDVLTPTAIATASSGSYLYVTAFDATAGGGYVFAFAVGSGGTLSALNQGVPYSVGAHPSAVASSPDGSVLYVTDSATNQILAFSINSGMLTGISGSPFGTGNAPAAVAVDATGKYVFVANSLDSNLTVYSSSGGALNALGTFTTGTQPVAVGIDPSLNQYLYTANFLGNSVSGFQLNATTGNLLNSQFSPSGTNANPTAVAAIPHGKPKT
jgi:6-phosphogluconolactonase